MNIAFEQINEKILFGLEADSEEDAEFANRLRNIIQETGEVAGIDFLLGQGFQGELKDTGERVTLITHLVMGLSPITGIPEIIDGVDVSGFDTPDEVRRECGTIAYYDDGEAFLFPHLFSIAGLIINSRDKIASVLPSEVIEQFYLDAAEKGHNVSWEGEEPIGTQTKETK